MPARRATSPDAQATLTGRQKLPGWDSQGLDDGQQLRAGEALYKEFNRFNADHIERIHHPRLIPPVVVELGELAGLIYRSDKCQPGKARTYIHFMEDPPRLVSNVSGTQLYIIGGKYQVTSRGIEG